MPVATGLLFTLALTAPVASAMTSGNGMTGGLCWLRQLPVWMCMAWARPGVKPVMSTAAVMILVDASQLNFTLPVGMCASVTLTGRAVAALDDVVLVVFAVPEEELFDDEEQAPSTRQPTTARTTSDDRRYIGASFFFEQTELDDRGRRRNSNQITLYRLYRQNPTVSWVTS